MTPRHHLDEATLVSYAAGALSDGMRAVAATHLEVCSHCRSQLAGAERIGGVLLSQRQPTDAGDRFPQLRAEMLARLDATPQVKPILGGKDDAVARTGDTDLLPRSLRPYFGSSWRALRWRWTAPGVHMIRSSRPTGDNLIMLKIAPGKSMPVHSHGGAELTQILKGAYDDALGHFGPGDMADLDGETEHQPITSPGVPCICVAALDAPLRFPGWFARKLQPLVRL
ncbi:MAG: ChrR family anti-sigma-E factor [Pseudomonadota bacterium]